MSEPSSGPSHYRVSYSEQVRQELRSLAAQARAHGLGPQFLAALKDIDQRLRIYPQFGEPLCNLKLEPAQIWIAVVPPLVLRYTLDEERRLVMVATLPLLLPKSDIQ